ncbi:YjzC family protein [Lentibacillus cibarius]|uniref:YjzC family protein n=1 Tax=Lentibacillus cibarius TaxID=2583219 RepID=A0A549YGE8_9BACI|nr:YjzC family protein [Lentibacillus cibarius]TMN22174.1 YjzC family protein [Lentibacillus cibarius]TRM10953.1 YjzC family protein [Lentibacillus cibarius]
MGEQSRFQAGDKAPNNGVYIEAGETGSNVDDPRQVKLAAGEKFPDNANQDRVWINKRDLSKPGVQGRSNNRR